VNHPMKGTCLPDCELWGVCHDGCGRPTPVIDKQRAVEFVRGHHTAYLPGHNPATRANTQRPHPKWSRSGIDQARLLPLLDLLRRHHGSDRAVCRAMGKHHTFVSHIRHQRVKCDPVTARFIVSAVQELRPPDWGLSRPTGEWAQLGGAA